MEGPNPHDPGGSADSGGRRPAGFYNLDSNQSNTSVFEDVEMAQDEVAPTSLLVQLPKQHVLLMLGKTTAVFRAYCREPPV